MQRRTSEGPQARPGVGWRPLGRLRLVAVTSVTAACLAAGVVPAAAAAPTVVPSTGRPVRLTSFEHDLLRLMNAQRTSLGLQALTITPCAEDFARRWAKVMARRDRLMHNPSLSSLWSSRNCGDASRLAENVGLSGPSAGQLYAAFMASPGHRVNILNPRLRFVGIGSWRRGGTVFSTVDFSNGGSSSYVAVKRLGQGLRKP